MKSYTDLKQSKKLAEILPIESADMHYVYDRHLDKLYGDIPYVIDYIDYKLLNKNVDIPCWSLGALLEHLREIDFFPNIIDSVDCVLMDISFYDDDDEDGKVLHPIHCLRAEGKTILDACYEMIIKLKELGIL